MIEEIEMVAQKKYRCSKCWHEWTSRKDEKPKSCPRCKRYDWEEKENG